MSHAFKSLVQKYVYLLRLDFARNASELSVSELSQTHLCKPGPDVLAGKTSIIRGRRVQLLFQARSCSKAFSLSLSLSLSLALSVAHSLSLCFSFTLAHARTCSLSRFKSLFPGDMRVSLFCRLVCFGF